MAIRFLSIAALFLTSIQLNAATVEATGGPFTIPDNDPGGVDIMFDFTGFNTEVSNLTLVLNLQHNWMGDLSATLTSPRGEAQMVIFSRVGASRADEFGDSTNFAGIYEFSDRGDDMWLAAAGLDSASTLPSDVYRTSTAGQSLLSNYGGLRTSLKGAFGDLISGSNGVSADGIWVLNIADLASGQSGTVVSASLIIDVTDVIFINGFESAMLRETSSASANGSPPVSLPRNRMDFNGNGLADYGVVLLDETLSWRYVDNEGNGTTGAETSFVLGVVSTPDSFNSADFDGDGIADVAAWNGLTAQYMIRRSARPGSPALEISIGGVGDYARVIGDYDGDGINDPAAFTNGNMTGEPLTLHYLRSSDGVSMSIPMGLDNGSDATVLSGEDYTGNGRADLILETSGDYVVRDGQTGAVVDTFNFGTGGEPAVMLGNFAGDNRADVTRAFLVAGDLFWETRETGPGTVLPQVMLGTINNPGTSEFIAQADYDGDGYQDYAVWRRDNADNANTMFIYRPSTNPSTTVTVNYGAMFEIPIARGQSTN